MPALLFLIFILIFISVPHTLVAQDRANTERDLDEYEEQTFNNFKSGWFDEILNSMEGQFDQTMQETMQGKLKELMEDNPFSHLSKTQVEDLVKNGLTQKMGPEFVAKNPKLIAILTDLLHHPKALPNLLSIILKKEKLKKSAYFSLGFFLLFIILSLTIVKGGLIKRFFLQIFLTLGISVANFATFIFLFYDEAKLAIGIILR